MSNDDARRSWWSTLSGVLTGVAALVTAVTGVMVAIEGSGPGLV